MGFLKRLFREEPPLFLQRIHSKDTGAFGEYMIQYALKRVHGHKKILKNLYVPYKGGTSESDVVLIHETGIYVFESKNYSGWIYGSSNAHYWTQTLQSGTKSYFYNPIWQNESHIRAISNYMRVPKSDFVSFIVFGENCVLKQVPANSQNYIILNRPQMLKAVKKIIRQREYLYTRGEVNEIASILRPFTHVSKKEKKEHIKRVSEIAASYEQPQKEMTKRKPKMDETQLYDALEKYRQKKSRQQQMKPHYVFNNRQLELIIKKMPSNLQELSAIDGIGSQRLEKYGKDILKIISQYQ